MGGRGGGGGRDMKKFSAILRATRFTFTGVYPDIFSLYKHNYVIVIVF